MTSIRIYTIRDTSRPFGFLRAFAVAACAALALPLATADQPASASADLQPLPSEMRTPIERYVADQTTLTRFDSTPLSEVVRDRMLGLYSDWQKRLKSIPFDGMSQSGKIDYLLFQNQLRHEQRMLEMQQKEITEAEPLAPFAPTIAKLAEDLRCMHFIGAPEAAKTLHALNAQLDDLRKSIDKLNCSRFVANRAADEVEKLKGELKQWFEFYNGYDPLFSWWVPETYKQLDANLQAYAVEVREKKAGIKPGDTTTIIGDPIGREQLIRELQYEMIAYTPEELLALGNREFAWCENEMKRASRDMGFGDDWHKALEKVKSDYVPPGEQPEMIRGLALEAIDFVDKHDWVTIPELARETWRMDMMTPERQLINPFFTGGDVLSVSYPTDTMTYEQKMMSMRGNNIPFARATVFHELIPGHELPRFYASRYRTWRRPFTTPFYVEGWSLYWEMLLWDMDFAKTPEERIGMLFWRMHRAARIIFSLNFHLGKWTPQECVDFLVNEVGHERDNATAEVRRSFLGQDRPLYQAAYMLGGLQLRSLRRELVDSGKMTNRQFHDAVLKENAIPIEMVKADLLNEKLTRDFKPAWHFYGEIRVDPNSAAK
ncbi:MAG TPA: DUF885 family protein [Bryobacteraceae bacterium]|nr:DUF885 family protein [Bryobacteraceae bacterium]